jgi:hypothetical protein
MVHPETLRSSALPLRASAFLNPYFLRQVVLLQIVFIH